MLPPLTQHVLLIPGHMCDARMWAGSVAALNEYGYEAYIGDVTGHDRFSDMAEHILKTAPQKFIAAGFSMGGMVAFELWRQAPERVAGLILIDTHPYPDFPDRAEARLEQQATVRAGGLSEVVTQKLLPHYFTPANAGRPDLDAFILDMALEVGPEVFGRQSEALRHRADARPWLKDVTCPTLIICGEEDRLCLPAWHAEMAAAIAFSRFYILPDAGHFALLEHPAAFHAVLTAWLKTAPFLEAVTV